MGSADFTNVALLNGILDLYLFDDPELEIACPAGPSDGAEPLAVRWALDNAVEFKFFNRSQSPTDAVIKTATDLICDSDEVLVFWDGEDEVIETILDIAVQQEKPQLILISNDETELEIYETR